MALGYVRDYKDLVLYRKAVELSADVFELTKQFPVEERYGLTSQMRRSARSIGAQVAEAWAKRRYRKHFISKLTDADAEQRETQHWVRIALSCGYLDSQDSGALLTRLTEIGKLVNGMIRRAAEFSK